MPIPRRGQGAQRAQVRGGGNGLFESAGFVRASEPTKKRLIIAVDGLPKSGKLHFALSGPSPIAIINTDEGIDGVVQKWQNDKEIWVKPAIFNLEDFRNMKPEEAAREADRLMVAIHKAYRSVLGHARTVIFDKATQVWELVRLSHFGKLEQVKPHHYVRPNSEFRSIIQSAYDQDKTNLILLHDMGDEYVANESTGNKKRKGFGDTEYLVQMNALCWRGPEPNVPDCFHMTVRDCRQNPELANMDFNGNDLNFPALACQVFPDTNEEFWT